MGKALFARRWAVTLLACVACVPALRAQDRLKSYPGYDQYTRMAALRSGAVKSGQIVGKWSDDGSGFDYMVDQMRYRFDVASNQIVAAPPLPESIVTPANRVRAAGGRERGRQDTEAVAPDGKHTAVYRERNLWISDADGTHLAAITKDGSEKDRIMHCTLFHSSNTFYTLFFYVHCEQLLLYTDHLN